MVMTMDVRYSKKLGGMASYIAEYLKRPLTTEVRSRAHKGIEDFCFNYHADFKRAFLNKLGFFENNLTMAGTPRTDLSDGFISRLAQMEGECAFLFRDSYDFFMAYRKRTGRGFGMLVNRRFLCRTEENYFSLVGIFYKSLAESTSKAKFLNSYFNNFHELVRKDKNFMAKSRQIFDHVNSRTGQRKLIWVDVGFQFTFSLFCYASIRLHSKNRIKQDIYSFSVYPWLQESFRGSYFSEKSELVVPLEFKSANRYESDVKRGIKPFEWKI
ncbi:MAG: hypothetical protein HY367_00665 [Candidatus Aenigmarchaeota archaeon]|nr:hypothetical protein [Candidatus Aenigmarchaeota archaeon]